MKQRDWIENMMISDILNAPDPTTALSLCEHKCKLNPVFVI